MVGLCRVRPDVLCSIGLCMLAAAPLAHADALALIGILQGEAVLVRQSTRFTLVEGAALAEGDIVETGQGAFMQIEFSDGTLAGVGEESRLILRPRLTALKTSAPPRLYQLEGWTKLRLPAKSDGGYGLLTPQFELDGNAGSAVVRVQPKGWAVFTEAGSNRVLPRMGATGALGLGKGDFAALGEGGDKPAVASQLPAEFVQALPRNFRESLPARADRFTKSAIQLQPLGLVSYEDVSVWLHTEPGIRLALSRQWRGRASDKAFRAAAAANLSAHKEWERVLFPERFLPKKPVPPPPPPPASPAPAASTSTS